MLYEKMAVLNSVGFLKKEKRIFGKSCCRVTNYGLNPDGIGYGSNKPNTINLWESGWKNWADDGFYNS